MQRSTLALGALVLVAIALIVLDPPTRTPAPAVAPGPVSPTAELPEGHPPLNPAGGTVATAASGPFGTVLEVVESGGYTYARVETDGAEVWTAGPVTPLAEGDEVSLAGAMGMQNFRAASLDRTFERILFLNAFLKRGDEAAASAPAPSPAPAPSTSAAPTGTVLEVTHAAGYSYIKVDRDGEEMWLAGNQLQVSEGQTVAWSGGALMQNFASPTLGRTFEQILFADGLRVAESG